jgi:hypothetical protein
MFPHFNSLLCRVEQVSGLLFRASRPKPWGGERLLQNVQPSATYPLAMKFGMTPNFTGATPVPPVRPSKNSATHIPLN